MIKRLLNLNIFLVALFFYQKSSAQNVYALITNSGSDNMSIINVSTNQVVGLVSTGAGSAPYAVAILSNGTAYIANSGNHTVTIFSGNHVTGTISVGNGPVSIAANPSGTNVYVVNNTDGTVSVINTTSNTVTATITVGGGPTGIVVSPDGNTVYVANNSWSNVAAINTSDNSVTYPIGVSSSQPNGIAITPDGQYLYLTEPGLNQVGVYKTSDFSNVANVSIAGGGSYGVAISPDGTKAYVTNPTSISVIRTSDNTVTNTIADPGGNQPVGVSFTPDGTEAFVVQKAAGNVLVINTGSATITNTIPVGSAPTSFSTFIGSFPFILPLHFTSFTVRELSNHSVQLNWNVQDQTDGTYYEVESSNDGTSFSKKALMKASGSSAASYSWVDASASSGTNFYRIRSVDISGKVTYSQTLKVSIGSNITQILIYPNPVKDGAFTLQLSNQPQGLYSLELVNISGQRLFKTEFNYTGGFLAQTVNLPNYISKGSYNLVVRNGSNQTVLKLIIE